MPDLFPPDIHCIYFDFDNVLARRTQSRAAIVAQLLGLPNPAKLRNSYFVTFHDDAELERRYENLRSVPEEIAFYRDLFQLFAQREGASVTTGQAQAAAEAFVHVPFGVMPGVQAGLEVLRRQYALGVFTNGLPSRHQEIAASGLSQYFEHIVISCDYGMEKPAREFYEKAVRIADMPAAHIALVDDEPANIAGAQAAGFGQAVLFTPAFWQQVRSGEM